jgi:hypothetical protein
MRKLLEAKTGDAGVIVCLLENLAIRSACSSFVVLHVEESSANYHD